MIKRFNILMLIIIINLIFLSNLYSYNIIPMPREIIMNQEIYNYPDSVCIYGSELHPYAYKSLKLNLESKKIKISNEKESKAIIVLGKEISIKRFQTFEKEINNLPEEGYILDVSSTNGKIVIILAGSDSAGTFYAVQTFIQIIKQGKALQSVHIRDYPGFKKERGYGEFFYGKPWTQEERIAALKFMASVKMNFYMYSPKDDPYNRDKWREDYPEVEIERMKELIKFAKENFITFSFAMNPGLSIKYSSEDDFKILMKKYERVIELGINNISLQIDDIGNAVRHEEDSKIFKNQGEAHAYLINKVYDYIKKKYPGIGFSTCGMMYYIAKPDEYTYSFGEKVYPEIPVMWTGGDVVDDEITVEEVYLFASGIKRKPFISDNYPVNDFAVNRLFMGPLTGRANDLVYHVYEGFLENPMNQEEASKIPLATTADYAWNPYEYNSEISWENAIRLVVGDKGYYAMRLFCENNRSSVMEKRESVELLKLINEYSYNNTYPANVNLKNYLSDMANINSLLSENISNRKLLEEIKPWSDKLEKYGKAALLAYEMQQSENYMDIEDKWNKWFRLNDMMLELNKIPQEICGGVIERFIYRTIISCEGLNINPYSLSAANENNLKEFINPNGSYVIDNIKDNNKNSFFKANDGLKPGDFFQITIQKPEMINEINFLCASEDFPTNFIYNAELHYTEDLKTWNKLDKIIYPEQKWKSEMAIKMHAVRIIVTKEQKIPPVIREFQILREDKPVITSTLQNFNVIEASAIYDSCTSSVLRINQSIKSGDSIELDFRNSINAGYITILFGQDKYFKDAVLQVSKDGVIWMDAANINKNAVRTAVDSHIKKIRIKSNIEQKSPIYIHEICISDKYRIPN